MNINVEKIEQVLNKLLYTTDTKLREIQTAKCPHYSDLDIKYVGNVYYHDDLKKTSKNIILKINNVETLKNISKIQMYNGPILDLINKNKIKPFILFINNEFIDYNNINLITDTKNSYLEIIDYGNIKFKLGDGKLTTLGGHFSIILPKVYPELIDKMVLNITCNNKETIRDLKINGIPITLGEVIPQHILLTNKGNILTMYCNNSKIFNLDFYNNSPAMVSIEDIYPIIVPDGMDIEITTTPNINKNPLLFGYGAFIDFLDFMNCPLKYKVTSINIINKNNMIMYDGVKFNTNKIKFEQDISYKIYPETLFVFYNGYFVHDPINYNVNIFEFEEIMNYFYYRVYYYKENISNDNITRFAKLVNYLEMIINGNIPEFLNMIQDPLDFIFSVTMNREDRILSLVEEICKYNGYLIQDYIDYHSNIEIIRYSSKDLINISDYDNENNVYILTKLLKSDYINKTGIIVFKNGLLYDTSMIEYEYHYIKIKFTKEELIYDNYYDIMIFNKVNNEDIKLKIEPGINEYLISNYISPEDLILLTDDIYNHVYKYIPKREELQYEIVSNIENIGNGYIHIDVPEYYYDRYVYLSSKRKFIHETYTITDDEYLIEELYKILLPETFKYCTNRNQFLIFHNGRKMNNSDGYICLNKFNLPFDKRFIHITKKCEVGDKIDIFYIPEEMKEVYISNKINNTGYIDINKSDLGYNFDCTNFSIFINGRRISEQNIVSIKSDSIRILEDTKSRLNISVLRHISYTDEIFELNKTIRSIWDEMLDELSHDDINELFNFNILLTNTEEDMKLNSYPKEMILYEILRRYWLINKSKIKVDNPIFYIREYKDILVLPINSSIKMIDIIGLLDENVINDDMVMEYGGEEVIPLDASKEIFLYDDIDNNRYIKYFQDSADVIPNDSSIEYSEDYNIIDLIIMNATEDMVVEYGGEEAIPIDALLEYTVDASKLKRINEYDSIDASIIRPYFYEDLICAFIGIISPIPIDSALEQIEELPPLYTIF